MKEKKKTKLNYRRLAGCMTVLLCMIGFLGYAAVLGWQYIRTHYIAGDASGKPVYYLLIGVDDGSPARSDTVILGAMNNVKKELTVISLPADTRLGRDDQENKALRDAYAEGGAEGTRSAVENLMHIRIDRYAVYDYELFKKLMDSFGGVDLYVEKDMRHDLPGNISDIQLRQGFQTLEGEDALGYMRYLDQNGGQIARIQREERFMQALLDQHRINAAIINWGLGRYHWVPLESDITPSEAGELSYDLTYFPRENIRFQILPGEIQVVQGKRLWIVNPVEIQKIIGITLDQVN